MFTPFELSTDFRNRSSEIRQRLCECLAFLPQNWRETEVQPGDNIPLPLEPGTYTFLKSGFIAVGNHQSAMVFLEQGDLIGAFSGLAGEIKCRAFGPVVLATLPNNAVSALCRSSPDFGKLWESALRSASALFEEACAAYRSHAHSDSFSYHYIAQTAPIIIEDSEPHEVFVMLAGSASVHVKNTIVGKVLTGEIFGAMAASLNSRRTASVIAIEPCVVSAIAKEHFFELARTYPQTVLKLIESMARIIVQQNERLAAMSM